MLGKLGGFEIAGLAGLVLGAAANRCPIVIDGFIASVAALTAYRLAPAARAYMISSHLSDEMGDTEPPWSSSVSSRCCT